MSKNVPNNYLNTKKNRPKKAYDIFFFVFAKNKPFDSELSQLKTKSSRKATLLEKTRKTQK
jgi:hypothetical protein